ncbi:MAG TPA: hypothetical protein PKD73_05960 [Burkholderiaceae bacterium]|nr:hypothetical protein [Burkholderiaceae bacterium]
MSLPKSRAYWKRLRPASLREAMQACKDHAQAVHNRGVERIAELMGQPDHWALYKWLQNGRMPACLIRPYEQACGATYITRYMAASAGLMAIDMPRGRAASGDDLMAFNGEFADALRLLSEFYKAGGKADPAPVLAALRTHLESTAAHHHNVSGFAEPELEFGE